MKTKDYKTDKCSMLVEKLRSMGSLKNREGMSRYGIRTERAFGVSVASIRSMAETLGKNHSLAKQLWRTSFREARLLAVLVDAPEMVTEQQMESWVNDFDSWDVCDLACSHLFDKTPLAWKKAVEWTKRNKRGQMDETFVKRAGFVLMAALSVHDKKAEDRRFEAFFPILKREANDERNFVRKAVNWALRQIGKRNLSLNQKAVKLAQEIDLLDSKSAHWIARDALRELTSAKVQEMLRKKEAKSKKDNAAKARLQSG